MEYALSRDQVDAFEDHGYLILKQLFSTAEIQLIGALADAGYQEAFSAAKQKVAEQDLPAGSAFRVELSDPSGKSSAMPLAIVNPDRGVSIKCVSWVGGIRPKLLELGRLPKVTVAVAQLLRSRVADHLINQIHYKMSGDGVSFDWHQDLQFRENFDPEWRDVNERGSFVQVITAVDESNAANGGLIFVPKSHRSYLRLNEATTLAEKEQIVGAAYDLKSQAVTLDLQPGDTIFMHPLLLHKSDVNLSRKSRTLFINGFSFPGANRRPYPGRGSAVSVDLGVPDAVDLSL